MNINIICVGKIKEKYLLMGIEEYQKRLKPFINLNIIELKEINTSDITKNIFEEGKLILNTIKENDYVITLEINGENLNSIALAAMIKQHFVYSSNDIDFIIGGSNGLGADVIKRSNYRLSFGKMTYPHQLMRLILIEQIYRSVMINNNHKYHK